MYEELARLVKEIKSQGIERFIIDGSADLIFGEMGKLIGKDWNFEDLIIRIIPDHILCTKGY